MEILSNHPTASSEKDKEEEMGLLNLPDSLLLEVLSCLDATDLFQLVEKLFFVRRVVGGNQVFVQQLLQREQLPGDSLDDFLRHMERWKHYKQELQEGLFRIVFPDNENADEQDSQKNEEKAQVRSFLRDAIFNFTNRAAGAQPWYEELPLGPGTGFEFVLDLTANMRRVVEEREEHGARQWADLEEGDGTRVLPTWLSTRDYRREYGFFQFHRQDNVGSFDMAAGSQHINPSTTPSSGNLIVHDVQGNQYHVPASCRPEPVLLTGVLHRAASGLNMYTRILQRTVESGCPERALQVLKPEMLPSASWFRRMLMGPQKQRLPKLAALEMRERAQQLLRQQQAVTQALIWTNANQVLLRQQRREWNAISFSLWKLCQNVYGPDLTPPLYEMFEPLRTEENEASSFRTRASSC